MKISYCLPCRGIALLIATTFVGCSYVAVHTATPKRPTVMRTDAAVRADAIFWDTFHAGDYDHMAPALDALQAAYLADPSDAVTAAHIGWLHVWRLGERARMDRAPASITDDALLARRYFKEAVNLDPGDARYLGFLAATTLADGTINKDERITRQGYFLLLDSIKAWPEFNLFTAGYVTSNQPKDSNRYRRALEWQWRTLDVCLGKKLDRSEPRYTQYQNEAPREGTKRVCWNSWIAPHNVEGFMLNMGDMLVKAGDWQLARKIYANATLSSSYGQWKYREVLERRIVDAEPNVALFNAPAPSPDVTHHRMMFDADYSCMACHRQ